MWAAVCMGVCIRGWGGWLCVWVNMYWGRVHVCVYVCVKLPRSSLLLTKCYRNSDHYIT